MTTLLGQALDLIERSSGATTAAGVGRAFHEALQPYGLRASFSRAYGPRRDDVAESVYSRISPPGWEELYVREKLAEGNFLIRESRRRTSPFSWMPIIATTPGDRRFREVLLDNGYDDGLGIPCHGPNGYLGIVSLGFAGLNQLAPIERSAITVASVIVHDRMRALTPSARSTLEIPLSVRERDCLGFVAEGKSDWEIGIILSIAQTTVHTHVENAKRKLGARTRAQACARAIAMGVI